MQILRIMTDEDVVEVVKKAISQKLLEGKPNEGEVISRVVSLICLNSADTYMNVYFLRDEVRRQLAKIGY